MCRGRRRDKEALRLSAHITAAYEIKAVWQRYRDAEDRFSDTETEACRKAEDSSGSAKGIRKGGRAGERSKGTAGPGA